MKKAKLTFTMLASTLLISSCAVTSSSSSGKSSDDGSGSETSTINSEESSLQSEYGEFSISNTKNGSAPVFDDSRNVYTIQVSEGKAIYTCSGYLNGKIEILNSSSLASYKGVELIMNDCYIKNDDDGIAVDYQPSGKYVQIDVESGKKATIVSNGVAINSENNLRFGGDGTLKVVSNNSHGLKGEKIGCYGGGNIDIEASADAIHGHDFYTNNLEDTDTIDFSGVLSLRGGSSEQALDLCDGSGSEDDPWVGSVYIGSAATVNVSGAGNVGRANILFQVDGTLDANNITGNPLITKLEGALSVVVNGSFTVNGTAIESMTV
ncbi:MAG: carbohydrate-binding domain-containing protein [Bacilli bacterium]|jgi:hypothetical protein|nr:carbohydrate-binding domain-containing protein [Bacilli bacterium]MCH4211166.1 carbohydrate-binding domain-containing protein [Bacilli bacterium]MCH4228470.1 carbohydrate-binding domain-containing protein [Bacilli bacterium]MCH4277596.1 carbohydrate-binding domain-containing protein [Bacilli bacterium]MCI2054935.1 carbohydrate-binding domain-containing protein [Bacilli bacterium]